MPATAALASGLLAVPATAGDSGVVSPPSIFRAKIAAVRADAGIDVYLPSRLRVFAKPTRVAGDATAESGWPRRA